MINRLIGSFVILTVLAAPAAAGRRDSTISEEEQAFQSACQLYQESARDKSAAIEAYERFTKKFSDSPLAADAQFMIGEGYLRQALSVLKEEVSSKKTSISRMLAPKNQAAIDALKNARDAFGAVVRNYRKSGLAASAQYRLGEVAYNQKDWGTAVEEFRSVEKNFPKAYLVPESWMGIIFSDIALEQFSQAEANLFMLGEAYPNYLKVPDVLYAKGIIELHKSDFSNAEKDLRQVDTPEATYYLGKTYLLAKKPFLAATAFERLVRDFPDSELKEEADFFIGDSFFLAKDFDGAITKYQRFLERYPDSQLKVAALFRIGSSHFQKKEFVDARSSYQSVLDKYPQDFFAPIAQYFISESFLVAGQMREALFAYTKVITQFPETMKISPLAQYKLAWTQYQVGDYTQATQTCQNFIALYPTHTLAKNVYLIMGNALVALKRYSEATTAWQRIIDLAPTSEVAEQSLYSILQAQYQLKNFDSILTSYQYIFRHLPPSQSKWRSLSYLYAAEAYLSQNQVDEAQAIYEMILKVYPNDSAALYAQDGLAWCYAYRGDDQRAMDERRKLKDMMAVANSTFGFSASNELAIADSMFNQKNYDDAYQLYDKFVRNNFKAPEAPSALFKAGLSAYHSKYYSQAVEIWQRVKNDYPKSDEALQASYKAADTLFGLKKYAQATDAYKEVIEKYPKDSQLPLAYARIGRASFNNRDDSGTVSNVLSLIERFPDSQEAKESLDLLEDVFDRNPKMDFQPPLREIMKNQPRKTIAGDAQFRLARRLFERKDYRNAAVEFQNFSVDYTGNAQLPKAQFLLAESFFQAANYKSAVPAFQRFLNNFPHTSDDKESEGSKDTALALFHLGSAHYNLKDFEPATQYYQRLLEEYPDFQFAKETQFNLALAYKSLGKLDASQEAYQRYIRAVGSKDQTAQAAQWELFGIQKDRKDYEAALETLKQIEGTAGAGSDAFLEAAYREGEIQSSMNRPDEALAAWERLRDMKPGNNAFRLQGLIKLGEIYEKTDVAKAIGIYEDLAKHATTAQVAQAARERANGLRASKGAAPSGTVNDAPAPKKKKKSAQPQ